MILYSNFEGVPSQYCYEDRKHHLQELVSMEVAGDMKCMFPACQEKDTMKHVLEFYSNKVVGKFFPTRDWANYLADLDKGENQGIQPTSDPM